MDLLFYEPYAEIIAEDAIALGNDSLTIGILGLWGAGKSTLLKLIEDKYNDYKKVLCININAWMFEGYEDAIVKENADKFLIMKRFEIRKKLSRN